MNTLLALFGAFLVPSGFFHIQKKPVILEDRFSSSLCIKEIPTIDELSSVELFNSDDESLCIDFLKRNPDITQKVNIDQHNLKFFLYDNKYCTFLYKTFEDSPEFFLKEKVVGMLILDKNLDDSLIKRSDRLYFLVVRALGVDSDYRRSGIATKFLQKAEKLAREDGYSALDLYATSDEAKKCYKKFGFQQNAPHANYFTKIF